MYSQIFLSNFPTLTKQITLLKMQHLKPLLKSGCALFLLSSILSLYSCENRVFQKGINEGKIEYDISYPNVPEDNVMLDLMPKKMRTTFINNNYRSDIIAGMGIFKTSIICKEGNDKLLHSIKMLRTKYASELTEEDFLKFSPEFNSIEVSFNDETKEIAGYSCKGADITVQGDSIWSFKVFYTDEIVINNANSHTPFKEIAGVLMEYQLVSNNILMQFTAIKVLEEQVELTDIDLEEGYEMIEPMKLKAEIEKLFSNIM
ncbi:MAG: hypothetical protein ACI9DK_002936 [Vicingaceae bacterium]